MDTSIMLDTTKLIPNWNAIFGDNCWLPSAKEVWVKLMFLNLSVILFTGVWEGLHPAGDTHPTRMHSCYD